MAERPLPRLRAAQFQAIREKVDGAFLILARELEDCYYGTAVEWDEEGHALKRAADGWIHGASHPFDAGGRTYDVQATPPDSKALFDRLHGLIWHLHAIALSDENDRGGKPYKELDIPDDRGATPRQRAQAAIAAFRSVGIGIGRPGI